MMTEIKKWLSQLPMSEEITTNYIELDGFLLRSPLNIVRLIVDKICIEIDATDLLKIEERTHGKKFSEDSLIPVRAQFRTGAGILDVYPSDIYMKLVPKSSRPFVTCVREGSFRSKSENRFHALESEFLRKHGLIEE